MFTLNNPDDAEKMFLTNIRDWSAYEEVVQYINLQEEKGEHTGTIHLQGYIEFKKAFTIRRLKSLFGVNGRLYHWERRLGNQEQAIKYVTKEKTKVANGFHVEFGTPKRKGNGGTIRECALAMKDGKSVEEVADEFPGHFLLHPDKIIQYALSLKGKRDWAMEIEIFVGKSGTGKSSTAKLENEGAYEVAWPISGHW